MHRSLLVRFDGERGMVLILVLMTTLLLTLGAATPLFRLPPEVGGTSFQRDSTKALYVAESGVMAAIAMLRMNPYWNAGFASRPLNDAWGKLVGYYTVQVQIIDPIAEPKRVVNPNPPYKPDTIEILSTGVSNNVTRRLKVDVVVQNPSDYFVATDEDVAIASGVNVAGKVYGKDIEFWIYGSHPADDIYVEEAMYYSGTADDPAYLAKHSHYDTVPTSIKFGPKGIHHVPRQVLPIINLDTKDGYGKWGDPANGGLTLPDGSSLSGNLKKSDGTVPPSGVIYVDGDLTIGNVIAQDQVTIVAKGSIIIVGDIRCTGGKRGIGLLAKKDVIIADLPATDNLIIENAQVIAQGGSTADPAPLGGKFRANGAVSSKTKLTFSGAITVKNGVELNAFKTRTLSFDPGLSTDPLPHMTYMVGILRWKEN